jgi:hypothetical protein
MVMYFLQNPAASSPHCVARRDAARAVRPVTFAWGT